LDVLLNLTKFYEHTTGDSLCLLCGGLSLQLYGYDVSFQLENGLRGTIEDNQIAFTIKELHRQ
jgi:hypothetical protein